MNRFNVLIFYLLDILVLVFGIVLLATETEHCCCTQAVADAMGIFYHAPAVFFIVLPFVAPFVKHRIFFLAVLSVLFIIFYSILWVWVDLSI